jgi:hypothetical protein
LIVKGNEDLTLQIIDRGGKFYGILLFEINIKRSLQSIKKKE